MEPHECSCGGSCGCTENHTQKVYLTREEYIFRLETYLNELKEEITNVEAELADLRQKA